MSRLGCLLLMVAASTQVVQAKSYTQRLSQPAPSSDQGLTPGVVPTPVATVVVPTVSIPRISPVLVPTVALPRPTAVPTAIPKPKPRVHQRSPKITKHPAVKHRAVKHAQVRQMRQPKQQWVLAYLSSYCPGSAGGVGSSGLPVFYGMLANNYYPFGTHVYLPVLGITGVVEDHVGAFPSWYHFDVWSPVCYSTPTGYFRVAVQS